MSKFDKWFSADGTIIPVVGDAGYEGYVERKIAYRAALEMVFGWLDYSTEHEEIKDRICKELEDE